MDRCLTDLSLGLHVLISQERYYNVYCFDNEYYGIKAIFLKENILYGCEYIEMVHNVERS